MFINRAAAHLTSPVGIADYRCCFGAGVLVLGERQPSAPWLDAKDAKKVAAHDNSLGKLQITTLSHRDLLPAPCENARQSRVVSPNLFPHRSRQLAIRAVKSHSAVPA